jgi:uncharacterized protein YndB with AHSA1/START domain
MKRSIKLKWFYPYPVETVWNCITDPDKLKEWSNLSRASDFKAEVGFRWMEEQKPRRGWDGKMYFEVLEVIPLKKLSYSFKGGPDPSTMTLDTIVTWTLITKNGGTELRLEHTGFEGLKGLVTSLIMEKGWNKHYAKKLMKYLTEMEHEHSQL